MDCSACGKHVPPGMVTCPHCHTLITQQHTGVQPAGSSQDRQIPAAHGEPVMPGMHASLEKKAKKPSLKKVVLIAIGVLAALILALLVAGQAGALP